MSSQNKRSAAQIRAARCVALAPLLKTMGYRLHPLQDGNEEVIGLPRPVIIKEHYWHCPEDQTGGNAIDLLTQIMGMSFNEAMSRLEAFI